MNALMYRICLILIAVVCSAGSSAAKDWRGILPLHSTRAEVESLLGPPPDRATYGPRAYSLNKLRSVYFLEEGEVYILFAEEESDIGKDCLSTVPKGTVLMIQVTPKTELSIQDLQLDEKRFRRFNPSSPTSSGFEGFADDADGFVVRTYKGIVEAMVYIPSALDRARCPAYYASVEGFVRTIVCGFISKFDEYGDLRFSDEKARLDNFAIQLSNMPDMTGHIIVYAGQKALVAEAQLRGNRAKDYLVNVRGIDHGRVTVVDGGHRESLTVELYVLPPGVTPPEPTPTVEAKDVQILYEKPKRRGRKK